MIEYIKDFPDVIKDDFIGLICGKLIGDGAARQVYECTLDDSLVVKVEWAKSFQNTIEWEVWSEVKDTDFAKYFAPVVAISCYGNILIMKKTEPMKKYPEMIPAFFSDTKKANYGKYKGHFCCHDYGLNNLMTKGMTKRMVKAYWWA